MAIRDAYGTSLTPSHVRTCLAVAEAASFSDAALELDVSRASVSTTIARAEEVLATVEAGRAEVGLVVARTSDAHLHWSLFDDDFAICVPAARANARRTWEDLRDLPLIVYDKEWRDSCVAGMQEVIDRFEVEPRYRIRDTGLILGMIVRGLGFSVLPALALPPLLDGVARVELPLAATRTVFVAVPPDLFATPAVRATLSVLAEAFPHSEIPPGPRSLDVE